MLTQNTSNIVDSQNENVIDISSNIDINDNKQNFVSGLDNVNINQNSQTVFNNTLSQNEIPNLTNKDNLNVNQLNNINTNLTNSGIGSTPVEPSILNSNQGNNIQSAPIGVQNSWEIYNQPLDQNSLGQVEGLNNASNESLDQARVLSNDVSAPNLDSNVQVQSNNDFTQTNSNSLNVNSEISNMDSIAQQNLNASESIPEIVPHQEENASQQTVDNTVSNNTNDINNVPNLDIFGI